MKAISEFHDFETGHSLTLEQTGVRGQFVEISTDGRKPFKVLVSDLEDFLAKRRQISLESK